MGVMNPESRMHGTPTVKHPKKACCCVEANEDTISPVLLTESENTSKQDKPLKDWLEPRLGKTTLDPLIPAGASLDFADYKDFIEKRRAFLKAKLEGLVGVNTVVAAQVPLEPVDVE